ncbi:hypothetical protein GWN63_03780 [Candidatus Bathyarchaeota archaeon]|nr:hypothetical protein [Candidatus Bathyarchaeota archaeon]
MLGRYENFPEVVHSVAIFAYESTEKGLQQAILRALHRLNQLTHNLNVISPFSTPRCEVSFEFGVAEGLTFNYLDREELERFQKSIKKQTPPTLDFFCAVRYHILKEGRRRPLKFDYHLLRFAFHGRSIELQVSHERGIRRVSPEDLINFIIGQIREELSGRN